MSRPTRASPLHVSRRRAVLAGLFVVVALSVLYVVVPRIAGLDETWRRLGSGDPWWLGVAATLELASFAGYVLLFRSVFGRDGEGIGWALSWRITLAGVVASRVLAAGGVGGIALTVWALRRTGMSARRVATRMTAFMVLLYGVYMLALVLGGLGLRGGVLSGPAPWSLTIVPAIFGGVVIAVALLAALVPSVPDVGGRLVRRVAHALGVVGDGVRGALGLLRTGDVALLGALAWWAFDVGVLWACLAAFGEAPAGGVVVMAYFVGTLANLLPLPGGAGAVEGGIAGALIALGTPAGPAIAGVLAYRAYALWLPTVAGVVAYVQLARDHS